MLFDYVENNVRFVSEIKSALKTGQLHHGYIFEGPLNVDKKKVAMDFAKAILCENNTACGKCSTCKKIDSENYIDLFFLEATSSNTSKVKSVKDADVLNLQEHLMKKPFEGERNIAIIKDVDTMTNKAFNRFLKTLEEPPLGTVIILLSENIERLPKTIVSRCVNMRILPWKENSVSEHENLAEEMVEMLWKGEPYYQLKELIGSLGKEKENIYLFLENIEEICRNRLVISLEDKERNYYYKEIELIEEAKNNINKNINSGYVLKNMVLTIGGYK